MGVQAVSLNLQYVKTIGIVNNGDNGLGFSSPSDLAVSRDGRIFVMNRCDPMRLGGKRVGVLNLDEDYLFEFGNGYGAGDGQFMLPVAIAFDSEDRLYVTDEQSHRVSVFDSSGNFLSKWGIHGVGEGQLNGPAGINFDSKDNAYIADQHNHRVHKFTNRGEHILQFGKYGGDVGQFNMPWGVAVDSQDNVYVADWRNDRIQKFASDGRFLAMFGEPGDGDGQFHRPSGVAVDARGYIYVSDWGNERVQVLAPDGEFELMVRGQATLSKWAKDFFAANQDEQKERDISTLVPPVQSHLSTPYHISSQTEPYFWGPVAVTLDRGGRLYVTESNRHRVQIYQNI